MSLRAYIYALCVCDLCFFLLLNPFIHPVINQLTFRSLKLKMLLFPTNRK